MPTMCRIPHESEKVPVLKGLENSLIGETKSAQGQLGEKYIRTCIKCRSTTEEDMINATWRIIKEIISASI